MMRVSMPTKSVSVQICIHLSPFNYLFSPSPLTASSILASRVDRYAPPSHHDHRGSGSMLDECDD
jgi:hypothetical protein